MGTAPVDPPRALSDEERRIVSWLLEHGDAETRALVTRVDALRVVYRCDCGCPSVDFEVHDPKRRSAGVVADAAGETPEGVVVGVMLWAGSGRVAGLEVYSITPADRFGLPILDTLEANAGGAAG